MRQDNRHADRRHDDPPATALGVDVAQRHVVRVLVVAQILGGLGAGATLSLGALLAAAPKDAAVSVEVPLAPGQDARAHLARLHAAARALTDYP